MHGCAPPARRLGSQRESFQRSPYPLPSLPFTQITNQGGFRNITMDARMWPLRRAVDVPVLNRVVVNIIHMPFVIVCVANHVLPIPPLPDSMLAFANSARVSAFTLDDMSRKPCLDQYPPHCKVRGALLQRPPYCVPVIRQDHERINVKKGAAVSPLSQRRAKPPHGPLAGEVDAPQGSP